MTKQYDLYGGIPPHVDVDTSLAAAISMLESAENIRADVYRYIAKQGTVGAICDEIERALDLRHQTASARVRELALQNVIVDSGKRRLTSSRRNAVVWIVATLDRAPARR